nr:16S rRNA (guanine(527)-N(7))-methyltransferase RsmG [uncultured Dethiosulfovibrio sp.]
MEDEKKLIQPNISKTTEDRLRAYCELLSHWSSEKVRLTGPKDKETIWSDHIQDCLFALSLLPESGRIIDVGTGGGLPGAAWAICRPDLEVFLLDSQSRKTNALTSVIEELGLKNVQVLWGRSEEIAKTERESFDLATARGVSELGIVAEYLSPLVAIGGTVLAIKGPGYVEEMEKIGGRWNTLALGKPEIHGYVNGERQGFLISMVKTGPCPDRFPRKPGKAEKTPWWEDKR